MRVAVCVDDAFGMLFFGKRQSRDRVLIQHLIERAEGRVLISPFSRLLFEQYPQVTVSDTPLDEAQGNDLCFIENLPLAPYEDKIDVLYVYHWNRSYPSDKRLDIDLTGWRLRETEEFVGSSHEKITKETYVK